MPENNPSIATSTHPHGNSRHGHSPRRGPRSRTYQAWCYMKTRCFNPSREDYYLYGGRGILVCDRWRHSFSTFLEDMGECANGMTLERKNPDGNYEPDNCKWASRDEQANNKRTTTWVTYKGRTQNVSQWAKEIGIHPAVLRSRIQLWGIIDRAFTVSGTEDRTCPNCGAVFQAMLAKHRFCTRKCRAAYEWAQIKIAKAASSK